jgi:hypothetical protein
LSLNAASGVPGIAILGVGRSERPDLLPQDRNPPLAFGHSPCVPQVEHALLLIQASQFFQASIQHRLLVVFL